jgi:PPP family 3-phenylpropionic acid transporter
MAIAVAAVAGAVRWLVSAATIDLTALVLMQPLHGVTFALLHLACMRLLGQHVPRTWPPRRRPSMARLVSVR